jgi:hypothetical protein
MADSGTLEITEQRYGVARSNGKRPFLTKESSSG